MLTECLKISTVPIFLLVVSIFTLAMFMSIQDFAGSDIPQPQQPETHLNSSNHNQTTHKEEQAEQVAPQSMQSQQVPPDDFTFSVPESCDLSAGEWVYDNETRPLYREHQCEYIYQGYKCMDNGREDDSYQKWRWQPQDCSLPNFDAKILLERLRGKRLMFVGDSLNQNQWQSMVCMVQSVIPSGKKSLSWKGEKNVLTIFHAEEYNATVEFYWAPFLVQSNSDNPEVYNTGERLVMADSIAKYATLWEGVDYLVFNTYVWWKKSAKIKVVRGSLDEGSKMYDEIDPPVAYTRALRTWAKWVEENVDPRRTSVLLMSASPEHYGSDHWREAKSTNCAKEMLPMMNKEQLLIANVDEGMFAVASNATKSILRVPIKFIDITGMSELRKDAHMAINAYREGKPLTPEQKADPTIYADCTHWCLPGLPDTWNELLYARIISS